MHREFDLAAAVCSRSSNGATRGDIPFVFRSECEIDSARSFRIRFVIGLFFSPFFLPLRAIFGRWFQLSMIAESRLCSMEFFFFFLHVVDIPDEY